MLNSKDVDTLTPEAKAMFQQFRAHAQAEAGLVYLKDWMVTCFFRDQEMQDFLYSQGRTRPGPKVTWTKHSRHTERRAWDIVIRDSKTGKIDWNVIKADVDMDNLPDYEEMADVGRRMGLIVGADFAGKDWGHFEVSLAKVI